MHTHLSALSQHLSMLVSRASAQIFDGPGLDGGVDVAGGINGPLHGTLRGVIIMYLYAALSFLALAGVIMIVAAGFFLVFSQGSDEAKEKAKKIILYVIIGILIIFIARSIVGVFLNGLQ